MSEYECLYGHRKSLLLLEKLPNTRGDLIEINEGKFCDISMALKYIHSDTSVLCFSECSALTYAHTGHFMKMDRLCKQVISQASEALSMYIKDPVGAISNTDLPMTVWDAIAILHLFDDPDNILGNINFTDWYQR